MGLEKMKSHVDRMIRYGIEKFYTPKSIAELIVRWCIRTPGDRVFDPGCGSGIFLLEAYRRLAEFRLGKPFSHIGRVPEEVHRQILEQLYGVDIDEFSARLAAINLADMGVGVSGVRANVFVVDYFTIIPGCRLSALQASSVLDNNGYVEIVFKDFDAVVGNPPYTRWTEIPASTREKILELYSDVLRAYGLYRFITGGAIPGIYIPWIMHSGDFLRDGGRLGMIISDSWLQAEYGVGFLKYLVDNFKVDAIIDISPRVFEAPLIGTCIVLLEKCSDASRRASNTTVLMHIDAGKALNVDEVLKAIEGAKREERVAVEGYSVKTIRQSDLCSIGFKPIMLFFDIEGVLRALESTGRVSRLDEIFQPSEGNTAWSVYASIRGKGAGVGGEEFYYLTEDRVRGYNLGKYIDIYLKPLISSPERLKYFTFTEHDWAREREYMLVANAPHDLLPRELREYIRLGEVNILLTKGRNRGRPVSSSSVARIRKNLGKIEILDRVIAFHGWYDLGGVIEAPIYAAYGTRYWVRFVLAKYRCALDHRILTLIPRQRIRLDETELKALLAYLNSSFTQIQAEAMGRTAGGVALLELDVKPLSRFLILDVRKLPREDIKRLAHLFDKLETEARRLRGADTAENILGSELTRELTGRTNAKPDIKGLFNTVIKEIDYEVARILGLGHIVESIRELVIAMARRRLSRALNARRRSLLREPRIKPRETRRRPS
jgi:type I restriction enzyme M protein